MNAPIGCAVIGYGPQHNFGWAHSAWIDATPELRLAAVCDLDPARTAAAKEAFPHIRTYNDVQEVWDDPEIELVSIVTPHFTHCPLTVAAFAAGKHVVVEKAMCLNVAEATAMVEAGRAAGKMLSVHHNRRHDGNYRRVEEIVKSGRIGEVFHIELFAGGFGEPQLAWYTEKAKSGGGFFYWGPHAVDWVLNLIPAAGDGRGRVLPQARVARDDQRGSDAGGGAVRQRVRGRHPVVAHRVGRASRCGGSWGRRAGSWTRARGGNVGYREDDQRAVGRQPDAGDDGRGGAARGGGRRISSRTGRRTGSGWRIICCVAGRCR